MESTGGPELRCTEPAALDSLQFTDEIRRLMSVPQDNASSFTALLELPAPQAVHLLHSPESTEPVNGVAVQPPEMEDFKGTFNLASVLHSPESTEPVNGVAVQPPEMEDFKGTFNLSSDRGLFERAVMLSAFAAAHSSPATASNSSGPSPAKAVKTEPVETVSSQPSVSDSTIDKKPNNKRKEREKKAKGSSKKSTSEADDAKLPYVHVRARRGQATDSHSLAERARREKINARMKLLQELVPGCNKISGTALILDEIINHVQSLQRHVEYLSMRLAAANPTIDFNLDTICAAEAGSAMCGSFPSLVMPLMWPEVQVNGNHQQFQQQRQFEAVQPHALGTEEVHHNYINPENALMSYDSSTNSAMLQSNRLKMEL